MWAVGLWIIAFIIAYATHWTYRWRNPKCQGILPPGSSGLPFIGESLQLIKPSYSLGAPPFINDRVKKYGSLFRTNIAGRHLIISTDVQVNSFIYEQDGKLVERWYLDSFDKLMNSSAFNDIQYIRGLLLRKIGVDSLKQKLASQFEQLASTTFQLWSTQDSTQVKSATAKAFLEIGAKIIYSCDASESDGLADKLTNLVKGLMSFPLNIPGTTYHKVLKERRDLTKKLSDTVKARVMSWSENREEDVLDLLVQAMKNDQLVTEDIVVALVLGGTFAAFEGTSFIFALALKFISENPSVLRELTAEHEKIVEQREDKSCPVCWDDYKSMPFTLQVIKETLRMGTTLPGIFRRVKKDFVLNGYTIPKGWVIVPAHVHSHYDPKLFKDPYEFNPWRWKDLKSDASKYFNPFGGGARQCAGAEYSRVIISIFLHVLVTKYRWEKIGGGDIVLAPLIRFKSDLRIKVASKRD